MSNAVIRIRTLLPGETEYIELTSLGTIERSGHQVIISYQESELTGMDDTLTTIILDPDDVTIQRQGDYVSTLEFSRHEAKRCLYHTPYGTLNVTTHTREYQVTDDQEEMELLLRYGLVIEGEAQGNTRIEMRIRPQSRTN